MFKHTILLWIFAICLIVASCNKESDKNSELESTTKTFLDNYIKNRPTLANFKSIEPQITPKLKEALEKADKNCAKDYDFLFESDQWPQSYKILGVVKENEKSFALIEFTQKSSDAKLPPVTLEVRIVFDNKPKLAVSDTKLELGDALTEKLAKGCSNKRMQK